MYFATVFHKFVQFWIEIARILADYKRFRARQRERFIEIDEIKDWSKGEGYFGNGRLF